FFWHDSDTTDIYALSLHDALPICGRGGASETERVPVPLEPSRDRQWDELVLRQRGLQRDHRQRPGGYGAHERRSLAGAAGQRREDRKSTRLNSSHVKISYAVF